MDKGWRNTFRISMKPLGAGPVGMGGGGLEGSRILFEHSHVAYQIEGNEE